MDSNPKERNLDTKTDGHDRKTIGRSQPSTSQGTHPSLTALRSNQPSWHPDLGLLLSRTVRKQILLFKLPTAQTPPPTPVCVVLGYGDPSWLNEHWAVTSMAHVSASLRARHSEHNQPENCLNLPLAHLYAVTQRNLEFSLNSDVESTRFLCPL